MFKDFRSSDFLHKYLREQQQNKEQKEDSKGVGEKAQIKRLERGLNEDL